jgi:predicted small secreted protein
LIFGSKTPFRSCRRDPRVVLTSAAKLQMNSASALLKAAVLATGLLAFLSLSSCNTMSGLGRDIGNAGSSLENAAQQ